MSWRGYPYALSSFFFTYKYDKILYLALGGARHDRHYGLFSKGERFATFLVEQDGEVGREIIKS